MPALRRVSRVSTLARLPSGECVGFDSVILRVLELNSCRRHSIVERKIQRGTYPSYNNSRSTRRPPAGRKPTNLRDRPRACRIVDQEELRITANHALMPHLSNQPALLVVYSPVKMAPGRNPGESRPRENAEGSGLSCQHVNTMASAVKASSLTQEQG